MRRVDRAIFAIFLLALVADVARSYASTPVNSEFSGSLIFSAASQFQNANPAGAEAAYRRATVARRGGQVSFFARRVQSSPVLAAWTKALWHPAADWSQVAWLQPAAILRPQSTYRSDLFEEVPFSSLAQIERAGNPAP